MLTILMRGLGSALYFDIALLIALFGCVSSTALAHRPVIHPRDCA